MKIIRLLILLCVIVCAASSCKKSEYVNLIPADVTMVASVDLKQMAEKGDVRNSSLLGLMNNYMGLVLNESDRDKVDEMVSDPSKMGIDFTLPIYLFKTRSESVGLTMKLGSEDRFEDFITLLAAQGLCSHPVERDGLKWASLLEDIDFAYNRNAVLFLVPKSSEGRAMCKVEMNALFSGKEENSFLSTRHYNRMSKQKEDVVLYSNMAALPSSAARKLSSFFPANVKNVDVEMLMTLNFVEGKAVLSSEFYSENEKVQQTLIHGGDNFRKIEGRFIDFPAQDFFVWGACGVQGEWLLSTLKKDKDIRQMLLLLECGIDVEMMIKAIDGDMAVVLPSSFITSGADGDNFIVVANVKNKDFLSDVDYWRKSMKNFGMTMDAVGKDTYLLKAANYELQWGVEDDNLFFATPAAYQENAFSPRSAALTPYKEEIQNSLLFLYVNLEMLPMREIAAVTGTMSILGEKCSALKSLTLKMEESGRLELTARLKEKDKNFLKVLFE